MQKKIDNWATPTFSKTDLNLRKRLVGRQSGTFYLENVDNSAGSFYNKQIGLGKSDTRAGLNEPGALEDRILL